MNGVRQGVPFDWRQEWWVANAWLVFLAFPLITVLESGLIGWRKGTAVVLIVLFTLVHVLGYQAAVVRHSGALGDGPAWPGIERFSNWACLGVLSVLAALAVTVAGWAAFGMLPFVVAFAMFNFEWSVSLATFGLVLVITLAGPALFDRLDDLWFFSIIVLSVGAGCAFSRLAEQAHEERSTLLTGLALSEQRSQVGRDVHDLLGHSLTAVILKAQVCARILDSLDPPDDGDRAMVKQCKDELAELDAVARRAMAEVRTTVGGLRRPQLKDELIAAHSVLADAGVALSIKGEQVNVPEHFRPMLAWVVRESVTNIVRHSQAEHCTIDFTGDGEMSLIRIIDDGAGLGGSTHGDGVSGMRERVEAAGAELHLSSIGGTQVEVRA